MEDNNLPKKLEKELTVRKVINQALKEHAITLNHIRRRNSNRYVATIAKQLNRDLKVILGLNKGARAFILNRFWSTINIWDQEDEKNNSTEQKNTG